VGSYRYSVGMYVCVYVMWPIEFLRYGEKFPLPLAQLGWGLPVVLYGKVLSFFGLGKRERGKGKGGIMKKLAGWLADRLGSRATYRANQSTRYHH